METVANIQDIEKAMAASMDSPIFIYKHSFICDLCDLAIMEWDKFRVLNSEKFKFFQVDVIGAREASKFTEKLLNIRHESPQVLLVWKKQCLWHANHRAIKLNNLEAAALEFKG